MTYWDNLGWKDAFDNPAYISDQWDYSHALHRIEVATPQVVVNGRVDAIESRPGVIEDLIRCADPYVSGPLVTIKGDNI